MISASDRLYECHKVQLAKVAKRKPGSDTRGLDCTLPVTAKMRHLKQRLKTKELLELRQSEIRRDNVDLVQKFARIITTPSEFEKAAEDHKLSNSRGVPARRPETARCLLRCGFVCAPRGAGARLNTLSTFLATVRGRPDRPVGSPAQATSRRGSGRSSGSSTRTRATTSA